MWTGIFLISVVYTTAPILSMTCPDAMGRCYGNDLHEWQCYENLHRIKNILHNITIRVDDLMMELSSPTWNKPPKHQPHAFCEDFYYDWAICYALGEMQATSDLLKTARPMKVGGEPCAEKLVRDIYHRITRKKENIATKATKETAPSATSPASDNIEKNVTTTSAKTRISRSVADPTTCPSTTNYSTTYELAIFIIGTMVGALFGFIGYRGYQAKVIFLCE